MVDGHCDDRFAQVGEMLAGNLAARRDHGAAVAVVADGVPVVDLWGGHLDVARHRPWERDSVVFVMSVTKGLTGICGNMCIERGLLDPDAPVASYWPEFAAAGKESVLVQHVFDHRAGLPDIPGFGRERHGDWDAVCAALASQAPAWEPGTAHAYHASTYGWLVGELVRRVSGRRPGRFLRDEVCIPLGADAWIGAPIEIDDRLAEVVPALPWPMDPRAEVPSSGGISNARALAQIFGVLACGGALDGVHLLDRQTIDDATAHAVTGAWAGGAPPVLERIRFARGFQLSSESTFMGPNPRAFGHTGAGGSIVWADPERRVSMAYTPNLFDMDIEQMYARANALTRCVYDCLD